MNTRIEQFDAVIVGAGFAGMYMLYQLKKLGLCCVVIERADGVGGTWYWNRYPGARCDIESMQYSYSFSKQLEQEWVWTERYATQPEILHYANHVADRFDLRKHIEFNQCVEKAKFNQRDQIWEIQIKSDSAQTNIVTAQFCIMATGCLSSPNTPIFKGLDSFQGPCLHTGYWPHDDVDFRNKRVAVIGTGSSAIQSIPIIAEQAKHVSVFQRTPNYIVPARNRALAVEQQDLVKQNYAELRDRARKTRNGVAAEIVKESAMDLTEQARTAQFESRWSEGGLPFATSFPDLLLNRDSNNAAAKFVQDKIHKLVEDPETARLLTPTSTFGCKRMCVEIDYYETFNRDNVELIDISKSGIDHISPGGPTVNGVTYDVDVLVLATGFDAMTGTLNKIEITTDDGQTLKQKWQDGPRTYLGLMIAGFPNLFTITGPGSPSVLSNMISSIEFHVDWITKCIENMNQNQKKLIEASESAEDDWVKEVNNIVDKTLYRTCNSWYLGKNIPGKPPVFMPYPGLPPYEARCIDIAKNQYPGFKFS